MTATNALQAQLTHQSLYRAASHIKALTLELLPDFYDAITLHIVIPDALDFIAQPLVLLGAGTSQFRLTGFGGMQVVTGRSDLDDATDRLDSVPVAVLVNKSVQDFLRRSNSAWAKYALARRRISFAVRSSRFSRSSALMRSRSSVVWPGLCPWSV